MVHCGGFIKPSPLLKELAPKLDYSELFSIDLVTKSEGKVIYSTGPAPNGYYIVPIYEVGDYVVKVKGPEGWYLKPSEAVITVDESTEAASCDGNDFILTGFQVEGKVSLDDGCTPIDMSGIKVQLEDEENNLYVAETKSNGKFFFQNVVPSEYSLSAAHSSWSFSHSSSPVDFEWDNLVLDSTISVSGFKITGEVHESEYPVSNVIFLLYSDSVSNIECENVDLSLLGDIKTPLCSTTSNTEGQFEFNNIPCGNYRIVPSYRDEVTVFDVIPKSMPVNVATGSVAIKDTFTVKGFSVKGKVVGYDNEGIAGVSISAEGLPTVAVTDENGIYTLDQVTSGTYTLKASKNHYSFESLSGIVISPSVPTLPDINIKTLEICGQVIIPTPPPNVQVSQRTVTLSSEKGADKTTTTSDNGEYCFEVLPGKYTVKPSISKREIDSGLTFEEDEIEIVVSLTPVTDVNFDQVRFSISGTVNCITVPCDTAISLSLSSKTERVTTGLQIQDSTDSAMFVFKNVLPGEYEVKIDFPKWCWEEETSKIEVVGDYKGVVFQQKGYVLNMKSSHETDIELELNGDKTVHSLASGATDMCLSDPGVYSITPISCYKFSKEKFTFSTKDPQPINLEAQKFLVEGTIEAEDYSKEQIEVIVETAKEEKVSIYAIRTSGSTFEFKHFLPKNTKATFTPTDSEYFFYPQSSSIVIGEDCPPKLDTINGRPGLYLEGSVSPQIEGVEIKVLFKTTKELATSPVFTDKNGKYRVGPLYDDKKYKITAEKAGFYLKSEGKRNFRSLKLGKITVSVKDEAGNPIPDVFLSLSGDDYRNNNNTDEDGQYFYDSLYPGDYYLKPLLKEYEFTPDSSVLQINDGEELEVVFSASRYAYSCFGSVTSLNGIPEKAVVVQAVGEDAYEEAKTDAAGNYRLRGLVPGKSYTISVKNSNHPNNAQIAYAAPESRAVTIQNEDIMSLNFVSFRNTNRFDISGTVKTEEKYLKSLQLIVLKDKEEVFTQKLGPSSLFLIPNLPQGDYVVQITSSLDRQEYVFETKQIKVDLEQNEKIEIEFPVGIYMVDTETGSSSVFGLAFLVALLVVGANYERINLYIKNRNKKQRKPTKTNWSNSLVG